jgi:hypothetical protein
MADLLDFGGVRVLTSNAAPGAGYVARFYESGTTTPVTVYTDATLGTALGTSVTADSAGRVAAAWSSGGSIKCVWEDATGAVVDTIDPVVSVSASSSGASDISFDPTVALPFTDVQAAIEGAAASAASGYAVFGIGITGNATLLVALDATNIGAGTYRFDGTTTGTYPTGVAAADAGIIEHWRQASGAAMQMLYHATTDRIFHRRMAASAWGTWRENITTNQGAVEGDSIYRGASAWTRLAKGTALQVLRMNSGTTAPEWASSGAPVLLASKTASASATLDFTEMNNTLYSVHFLRFKALKPTTDSVELRARLSSDAGVSYLASAGAYRWAVEQRPDTSGSDGGASASATSINISTDNAAGLLGNAAGEDGVSGDLYIRNAGSGSLKTVIEFDGSAHDKDGSYAKINGGGTQTTAALTDAIRVLMSSGTIASGTVELWGEV